MVELDRRLVHAARQLATPATARHIRHLIMQYEHAVKLQANGEESAYDAAPEEELRDFVRSELRHRHPGQVA